MKKILVGKKARQSKGYAFVEFEYRKDAEEAIKRYQVFKSLFLISLQNKKRDMNGTVQR